VQQHRKLACHGDPYCREVLSEIEPLESDAVTHGICKSCRERFEPQWLGLDLGGYLDQFEAPVLVVNRERRVIAANRALTAMLGRSEAEHRGLLGGEAMECAYAAAPQGCGGEVHCRTCSIRRLVQDTIDTGRAHERQPRSPGRARHAPGEYADAGRSGRGADGFHGRVGVPAALGILRETA